MKKINLSKLVSLLAAALAISPVFAQSNEPVVAAAFRSPSTPVVRPSTTEPAPAAVNAQVQRSFGRSFKGIATPHWYAHTNSYVAEFKTEGRRTLATFDPRGRLTCTVVYGTAKDLPTAERSQVEALYKAYKITAVQEVILPDNKLWVVTVESCRDIIKVRLLDGEVMELEQWQRAGSSNE